MSALQHLQRDFQSYVDRRAGPMVDQVVGTTRAGAQERLDIYADAYRLRLIEVLGNDFPALRALAGETEFDALARDYIHQHPSRCFNARWYGDRMPAFLAEPRWRARPEYAELATFEWMMTLAFDAADAPLVSAEDVAAIAPDRWPEMRPGLHPCVQRVLLRGNAPDIWKAANQGQALPAVLRESAATSWLLWRQNLTVYYRKLPAAEAAALEAAAQGCSFAEICESLCDFHAPEQVPGEAAGLLKRWVTDSLITSL